MTDHDRDRLERHVHLAGQYIGNRGCGALVGDVDDINAGARFEHLASEMRQGAGRGTEVQLVRVGLGVGDEFGDGAGRKMRCDCEHERNARDHAYRHEALYGIVARIAVERRPGGKRRRTSEQQCVAVGLSHCRSP